MGLMLENAAVQIQIGSQYSGADPTYAGGFVDFLARAKRVQVTDEYQTTNVAGAGVKDANGNPAVANRYHSGSSKMTLQGVVPAAGFTFSNGGVSMKGKWIKIEIKALSSLATYDVHEGVITKWDMSMDMGQPSMETIEIDLNADKNTATSNGNASTGGGGGA